MNGPTSPSESRSRALRRLLIALLLMAALALAVAADATVLAFAASASPAPVARRYTLSGGKVAVFNLAGRMEVVAGTGSDVVVEVSTGGPDASQLRVESGPVRGVNSLRVLYPGDHVVYPDMPRGNSTRVRVLSDGTFGDRGKAKAIAWWTGSRTVTVRSSGSGLEAYADLRVLVPRGQRLEVHVAAGEASVRNVDGDLFVDASCSPVTVDGVRGSLDVDLGSGDVEVRNVTGDLSLDTGSGSVHVVAVRGSRILIDTGSGGVEGEDLAGESLLVDTGSGHVVLRGVNAPDIKLDTGSGGVQMDLIGDVRSLLVDTGSGGVTLGVPASLGAEIEVDTGSGGINADIPLQIIRRDGSYFLGRIGDGRGRIRIDTGSGGVKLHSL